MSSIFITPDVLKDMIRKKENLTIFDASYFLPNTGILAIEEYKKEHIKDAIFFDIDKIKDPKDNLPHMFPSKEIFEDHMQNLGLNKNDTVVIYDNSPLLSSARCWFMLRYFGHHKIHILSGGIKNWKIKQFETSSEVANKQKGNFLATEENTDLLIKLDEMKEISNSKKFKILDARSFERFSGRAKEPRPNLKSGHMPNSLNLPASNLISNGTLIENSKFQLTINNLDINSKEKVIATCGSGVSACVIALAFYETGNSKVPIYDGSWTEWASTGNKVNNI